MLMIVASLQQSWWCPMCGSATGWGWGMMLMMLLWPVVLVVVLALGWRLLGGQGAIGRPPGGQAEDILKERYARGEIDRDMYTQMLGDLRRRPPA